MSLRVEVAVRITENSGLVVAEAVQITTLPAPLDTPLTDDLGEAGAALSRVVNDVREDALGQVAAISASIRDSERRG